MSKNILVAVAWPYANNDLHLGHVAGALLPADIFARYHRLAGNRVLMISGSDAHGTPITIAAEKAGVSPRELFLHYHNRFLRQLRDLGISFDLFTHTDTRNHHRTAQDLFKRLYERGHIRPATQTLFYSESQGRFLPDRYVEGICPHCRAPGARGDQCDTCGYPVEAMELIEPRSILDGTRPVPRETEHLFLDLPAFTQALSDYYAGKESRWRAHVINFSRSFVSQGLRPRPITRDLEWGIPVPLAGWENRKLYIWFENVIGYLSAAIEWAERSGNPDGWRDWWHEPTAESYYFLGQDNIPFHAVTWPAQLLGASDLYARGPSERLQLPFDIPANRQYMLEARAFSKSRGWAVWLPEMLEQFDPDAVRYAVAATLPEFQDSDFTWHEFRRRNNQELVATWGNLVHRVSSFAHKHWGAIPAPQRLGATEQALLMEIEAGFESVGGLIAEVQLRAALREAFRLARETNAYLSQAPWYGVVRVDKERAATTVYTALQAVTNINTLLAPFLPFSAEVTRRSLGFRDHLFGEQHLATGSDGDLLVYNPGDAAGRWAFEAVPVGQPLREPVPLYRKIALSETSAGI